MQRRTPETISLELDSRPESLVCVRALLAGAGQDVGLDHELLGDLRTAVSEACSNVVLHAYDDRPGPLLVDVDLAVDEIRVTVSDRGSGFRMLTGQGERMRMGIALISALADRAEFISHPGRGTEVRMAFASDCVRPESDPRRYRERVAHGSLCGDVVVFVSSASLLGGVLGRVCAAVATRAQFTVDRHADLELVTDAVAAHVSRLAPADGVGFSVVVLDRWLELTIGPLPAGSSAALRGPVCAGERTRSTAEPSRWWGISPLERLADEINVEPVGDFETLHVLMFDRRPAASAGRVPISGRR